MGSTAAQRRSKRTEGELEHNDHAEALAMLNTSPCHVNYMQWSITHTNDPLYGTRKLKFRYFTQITYKSSSSWSNNILEYEGQKNNPLITMFMSPFLVTHRT